MIELGAVATADQAGIGVRPRRAVIDVTSSKRNPKRPIAVMVTAFPTSSFAIVSATPSVKRQAHRAIRLAAWMHP
jgi:hypothetical protein